MSIFNLAPWIILFTVITFTAWWFFRPSARARKADFRVITASTLFVMMAGGFVFWQSGFRIDRLEAPPSEIDESSSDAESDCGDLILAELCLDQQSLEEMNINAFFDSMNQNDEGYDFAVSLVCGSNESCADAAWSCIQNGCAESLGDFVDLFQIDGDKTAPKITAPRQSGASSASAEHFDKLRRELQKLCRLNANPFSSAPSQLTVWDKIKELLKDMGRPSTQERWNFPGVVKPSEKSITTFLDQVDRFFKAKKISDALRLLKGLKELFQCESGACGGEYKAICDALKELEEYLKDLGNANSIPQDVIDNFKELLRRLLEDKKHPIK